VSQRLYAGLVLLLLLAGGALAWWTWSGPDTSPPARQSVPGLSDTASVGWTTQHTAVLNAGDATDALTALGYLHGMTRPWTVTVWRRTALGTLSAAFGAQLVPIDRHTRRLGFGRHAQRAYDRLAPSVQDRLTAYTRGLNAALQSARVQNREQFVYLNLRPERWAPWHPLAVERLLAWTGTAISAVDSSTGELSTFRRTDRRLRRWLHLHGRTQSVAWAARSPSDTAEAVLFSRHVFGSTADPIIQELTLRRADAPTATVASLPGAPIFPTGTTEDRAWSYLLDSSARVRQTSVDTSRVRARHERIAPRNGDERLVTARRYDDGLLLHSPAPDSAWVLQWPGLRPASDVPRWLHEASLGGSSHGDVPSAFDLLEGSGLTLNGTGEWTVRGRPPIVERGSTLVLIGRSAWTRHQAEVLRAHAQRSSVAPARWSASDSSTWAARLLPRVLPKLESLRDSESTLEEALSYLRNWDHVYEPASIGAVVFEEWMLKYREARGRLPSTSDSLAAQPLQRTVRRAVSDLTERYGPDVRRWRWERVAPDRRVFPVWSADSLLAADLSTLSTTRYAPLERPGRGHASAPSGGPSFVDRPPLGPAPTSWEGWTRSGSSALSARRLRFNPTGFFARSFLSRERPAPVSVSGAPVQQTTQLVPVATGRDDP